MPDWAAATIEQAAAVPHGDRADAMAVAVNHLAAQPRVRRARIATTAGARLPSTHELRSWTRVWRTRSSRPGSRPSRLATWTRPSAWSLRRADVPARTTAPSIAPAPIQTGDGPPRRTWVAVGPECLWRVVDAALGRADVMLDGAALEVAGIDSIASSPSGSPPPSLDR